MASEPKQTSSSQTSKVQQNKKRSSVSSSCSSVAAEDKFNPSKNTVFSCICKEYDGLVPFAIISKRRDLFPGNSKNIANWFRERKENFLLREDADGSILEVSSFCPKARLCFNYLSSSSCSREDCQYFHVCREYIAGSYKFFHRCKWNHDFQFDRDRKFISKLKLDGLTHGELCKVVQLSIPQVCLDYNAGCCKGPLCAQIHMCKDFVKRRCHDEEDCGLQHENALLTPRAAAILEKYGLKGTDANTKSMLKELLVCENSSRPRTESQGNVISKQTNLKLKTGTLPGEDSVVPVKSRIPPVADSSDSCNFSLPLTDENNVFSKQKRSATTWIPCRPTERQVFECLCTEYDCSASFSAIAKRKDLFPHGLESAEAWFRRTKGSFLITESDKEKGKISQVEAFSTKARLCLNYINNGKCQNADCSNLHVCKDYIIDSCSPSETCPLSHHFHNKRDKALLARIMLDLLTEQQLRRLVLLSTPQVCVEYNNGICSRGDSCNRIHICSCYLRKSCSTETRCDLDHESAMNTDHTRAVLKRLQLSNVSENIAMNMILDDKFCLSSKDKANCHIHQDKPDAPICSCFLAGLCTRGLRCLEHHCSLPYHWQYKVPGVAVWKSFGAKDNLTLENLYCDVNVETRVTFPLTEALDIAQLESEGILPLGQGYRIMIDIDDMRMFLKPKFARDALISHLRRLSTVPRLLYYCFPLQTEWTWYWKERDNVWHTYGKDRLGRDLQGLIERAFLDKLEQGNVREKFAFASPEHEYHLLFYPTGMYQINVKTGTKRPVKRRPVKLISNEDVDDLKWAHGDSSVKEQIRKTSTKYKYFPTHWSLMPPNASYNRAGLDVLTAEFKDVEQLFRRSMNDYVKIVSIDRVQNPFMLEKYFRKKEHMMATAKPTHQTVNEKRLFHGTSPDIVEAICKQNFDWRLHGKNATVYGEGSYFAVNASYSHAYAKRDGNSYQFMFLAKVLVGAYSTGHFSYRRPPSKNPSDPASDLYDSCVDNQAHPSIFVVFDTDQFYPEYIIQYSTVSQTASATASYALPQPSTAPSRPKPPSSQQQKGNVKHPARSSSTVTTSNPNRSTTRSSYLSTTTGPTAHQPKPSIHVVSATNSNVPVSRSGHSSTASRTNPSRTSAPLGTASNASGSSAQSGYASTAFSSNHGITSSHHSTSAVRSVNQASASNTSYATPSYSTSPFYSSTSRDVFPVLVPPKKKKGCLIM